MLNDEISALDKEGEKLELTRDKYGIEVETLLEIRRIQELEYEPF